DDAGRPVADVLPRLRSDPRTPAPQARHRRRHCRRAAAHRWLVRRTRPRLRPFSSSHEKRRPAMCRALDVCEGEGALEHDPEKWIPVFGKDHAPTKSYCRRVFAHSMNSRTMRSCSFGSLDMPRATWRAMLMSGEMAPLLLTLAVSSACADSSRFCIGG